jgi:outer membrane protein assembly factor BamB
MKRNILTTFSIIAALIILSGFSADKLEGNMFLSTDNGNTWSRADRGFPEEELLTAWTNHRDQFIAGTSRHGLYAFDVQHSEWKALTQGLPMIAKVRALASDGNILIASLEDEGLYSSADGGLHWQYVDHSPSAKVRGLFCLNQKFYAATDEGVYITDGLDRMWRHTAPLLQANAIVHYKGKIYVGTNRGIIRSNDDKNWEVVMSGSGVSQIIMTPHEMAAIAFDGKIILSTADGSGWTPLARLLESQYTCQIEQTGSKVLIEPWMSGLPFVTSRMYSTTAADRAILRKLIQVRGGILLVNTDDGC